MLDVGGFRVKFIDGLTQSGKCIFSLPTGFICITAMTNAVWLAWTFIGDDADVNRGKMDLQALGDDFPDMKVSPGYADLAQYLGLRV